MTEAHLRESTVPFAAENLLLNESNPFENTFLQASAPVVSSTTAIIDDGDPEPKFRTVGSWNTAEYQLTAFGDIHYSPAGTGANVATWNFTGLSPGTYRVAATWSAESNRATDAPYTIKGGASPFTVDINQEVPPDDFTDQGILWENLSTVAVTGDTLTVELSDYANEYVIADAIRIEPAGDGTFADTKLVLSNNTNGFTPIHGMEWSNFDRYPHSVADVTGDGLADLVAFSENGVYTFQANGDGTFAKAKFAIGAFHFVHPSVGAWNSFENYPRYLADVNGDGLADLVAFGSNVGNLVYTSLANGDGTFADAKLALSSNQIANWYGAVLNPPQLADVTGNGLADLVAFGEFGVYTFQANGDGTFADAKLALNYWVLASNPSYKTLPRLKGSHPQLGDTNGDGLADLVIFEDDFEKDKVKVYIYKANGDGTFADAAVTFITGPLLSHYKLGDINSDGLADLVVHGEEGFMTFLSKGNGTFEAGKIGLTNNYLPSHGGWIYDLFNLQLGDINGDRRDDLVVRGGLGIFTSLAQETIDYAPIVKKPIAPVNVNEDAPNTVIDLSDIFLDVNGDVIVKSIFDHSNKTLLTATINGYTLTLDYLENQSGNATITVRGTANGKFADNTFTVTVNPVDNPPINHAPIVEPDKTIEIEEDALWVKIPITLPTDPDGDRLTLTVNSLPTQGILETPYPWACEGDFCADVIYPIQIGDTVSADKLSVLLYTAPANFNGDAGEFTYTISDGINEVSSTINIEVIPINDAPEVKIIGNGTFADAKVALDNNYTPTQGGWYSFDRYPRHLADVTGDGLADIVAFAESGVLTSKARGDGTFADAKVALSNNYTPTQGGWNSFDRYPRHLADVTGDGLADIVAFSEGHIFTSEAKGDGTFADAKLALDNNYTPTQGGWHSFDRYPRHLADVTGDGLADIVGFSEYGIFTSEASVLL